MQFRALVVDSLRESLDSKIFWVLVAITLAIVAALICVGFESDGISMFFGLWVFETDQFDPLSLLGRSKIIGAVVYLLLDLFLGWIGVILMLIATAGVFPRLMERGAIGARGIGRGAPHESKIAAGGVQGRG